nr:dual specificity protein phosphatase 1-like [Lytechinus pictus]
MLIYDMPSCALTGGFSQFSVEFPALCVSSPSQPNPNMPTPPPAPISITPSHQKSSDKHPSTPTAAALSAPPPSPRPPLLRRGPVLSLPTIKCGEPPESSKYNTALKRPTTPLVPSGHQQSGQSGPGYECNDPVRLLPHLYLGSNFHASRLSVLEEHGITAVLNVSRLPNYFPTGFRYMQIPVDDNTDADLLPWFEEANNFIDSVERCEGRVLVHCHAGISRSATICLAYLMKVRQIRLEEAFEFVRSERTVISPNLAFMLQLLRFENELASSRKENTDQNSPCNHTSSSFFSNTACSSTNKYSDSALSPSAPSPATNPTGKTTSTRQLSLGNSPLLVKRMARSMSLPSSRSQNSSPVGTDIRKQNLIFNFNLPVLPKSGSAHSCALECPDLSPTPSPIFFPI